MGLKNCNNIVAIQEWAAIEGNDIDRAIYKAFELGFDHANKLRALPILNEITVPNSYYMQAPEFTGHVGDRRKAPRGDVARAAFDAALAGADVKEIVD